MTLLPTDFQVKELDDSRSGLELFGFYKSPPLDVIVNWSESRLLSISPRSFKGWPYYLNNGATLNISYSIKSEGSSALLIVDQVLRHFSDSLFEQPLYQKNALSWNLIRGTGVIELKISEASTYFVSLYNFNIRDVKVELDIDVKAVLYDTKQSFYKCNFSNGNCTYNTMSLLGNSFVLTSPALKHGAPVEGWYIRFSYQPRWIGYVIGTGLVICFTLVAIKLWKMLFTCLTVDDSMSSQRRRLLANKDDDGSSMGSSLAGDDADLEEFMGNEGLQKLVVVVQSVEGSSRR
ncbi:hypothetical protein AALP_AA4G160300 [Arabis alpina]|uniref:E3 ubiquitin-protein ligase APD1-4 middle domain-containing protein n=1 Tax=Arabis alpina TaxID=50452 RepID=A0A087H3L4_ARAAL|nr:hypothetical protein AALP_AA4G160300 [Arabis alpina]